VATAEYDLTTDSITLITQWQQKSLVKQIPGARWDAQQKTWRVPAAWASLVIMRGLFGQDLVVGDKLRDWSWRLHEDRIGPSLAVRQELVPDHDELLTNVVNTWNGDGKPKLYDFQRAGVQFMVRAGCGLLGDEMGAGKTPQTLSTIRAHHQLARDGLPALVICPNSVKSHWAKECATWLPQATPYVIDGSAAQKRRVLKQALGDPTALVVINIESARLFSRLAPYGSVRLSRCATCDPRSGDESLTASRCEVHRKELNEFEFRTVVLDEAHRVKDPKAKQTRAIWFLGHSASVRYRWALTGTPVANHPGDLWSIMHFVAPDEYPTKSAYVDRFCLLSWNAFGGMDVVGIRPDTREELFKILDPRFRRMLKAVVLPQLPPKVRETRVVELSTAQARAYRELETNLRTRLADGTLLLAPNQLVVKTRLMQFASASVTVEKPDEDDISSWNVTMREPSTKLDVLEEVLDELGVTTVNHRVAPVLIACEHLDVIDMVTARLNKLGVPHGVISGEVAPIDRQRALDDMNAGRNRALVFTGKAGGVGLNMSAADTLINVQRSWSLVDERQKEDRPHRPGAEHHDSIRIIDLVTTNTVEEDQVTRLVEKLQRLEEITRDRAALLATRTDGTPHATSELDYLEDQLLNSSLDLDQTLNVTD
jgi:SNF2 family DNA or RNA helicase